MSNLSARASAHRPPVRYVKEMVFCLIQMRLYLLIPSIEILQPNLLSHVPHLTVIQFFYFLTKNQDVITSKQLLTTLANARSLKDWKRTRAAYAATT